MRQALLGSDPELLWTAVKAAIMFVVAVVGLRVAERRVLAELDVVDVVVAVAVGAIIGRTSTSATASALTGTIALAVLLAAHRLLSALRRDGRLLESVSRKPVVLVDHGEVDTRALRRCGLAQRDLQRLLRQRNAEEVTHLAYVLFEQQGDLTVVPRGGSLTEALRVGLREAGVDQPRT